MTPMVGAALGAALAALLLVAGVGGLRRGRLAAGGAGLAAAALLGLASAGLVAVGLGAAGYHALTREQLAATVHTAPLGPGEFEARFVFPDGREARYRLSGDQLSVEARILKWHPWANLLGLHTAYELDRVAGRHARLADERNRPRTVYALGAARPVDLFAWTERMPWLAPLVDARYGSGTFAGASRPASYEVRVSTTGLLVRELPGASDPGAGG